MTSQGSWPSAVQPPGWIELPDHLVNVVAAFVLDQQSDRASQMVGMVERSSS
jgi:hypothetical protein